MPKYPREKNGLFGLDSTAFLWAIIGATLLAGGFFLFGMYYGYEQGYQAARESISDEGPERQASARSAGGSETRAQSGQNNDDSGGEERRAVITADQLSGTDGSRPGQNQSNNTTNNPREGVYGMGTSSGKPQPSTSRSTPTEDTTTEPPDTDPQTPTESTDSSQDRPRALSVTEFDTDGAAETEPTESTQPSTQPSASESDEPAETEGNRSEAIQAEGPRFTIQAVSFLKESRAQAAVSDLESKGYEALITEKVINGQRYYRVRVGSFSDRTAANNQAKTMVKEGHISDYWISRVEN